MCIRRVIRNKKPRLGANGSSQYWVSLSFTLSHFYSFLSYFLIFYKNSKLVYEYKQFETTCLTTEAFLEETRFKFKQLIMQKEKSASVYEDLAGIISRYCSYHENLTYYDVTVNAKDDDADLLGVSLVNLSHFSNNMLLKSDHFYDNVN